MEAAEEKNLGITSSIFSHGHGDMDSESGYQCQYSADVAKL